MDDKSKKSRSNLIAIDPREKKYAATALTIGGSAPDMIAWCQRITEHQSKERTGRDEKACNGAKVCIDVANMLIILTFKVVVSSNSEAE
jgi:hypothetical protein